RFGVQAVREAAMRESLAGRNPAQRVPQAPLEWRAFDEQRKIEAGVGVREVALELARGTSCERRFWLHDWNRGRQISDLRYPLVAGLHRHLHPRKGDDYVEHSFSICASRSSGISMPAFAARSEAKRRAPGRRTSGSDSIVETTASTRSANFSLPASAAGSMAMNAWPMRGLLPCSAKNESASGPMAAPVSEAQMSSNISASIAPFAPPIGKRLPCSIASFGSVVGFPCRSSAHRSEGS